MVKIHSYYQSRHQPATYYSRSEYNCNELQQVSLAKTRALSAVYGDAFAPNIGLLLSSTTTPTGYNNASSSTTALVTGAYVTIRLWPTY